MTTKPKDKNSELVDLLRKISIGNLRGSSSLKK